MSELLRHPAIVLFIGAFAIGALRGRVRAALVLILPAAALYLVWSLPEGVHGRATFLDFALAPLAVDALSRLFATVFAIMLFAGGLFAAGGPFCGGR